MVAGKLFDYIYSDVAITGIVGVFLVMNVGYLYLSLNNPEQGIIFVFVTAVVVGFMALSFVDACKTMLDS